MKGLSRNSLIPFTQAQFATLSDYFNELRKESGDPELSGASLAGFPTLSGELL